MAVPPDNRRDPLAEPVRLIAREHEPDRYLSALLAPRTARRSLIVLAAFAAEIGRIPDLVREPIMGELRLQWWRDVISGERGSEAEGSPTAREILALKSRYPIPDALLIGLIDAHAEVLHRDLPPDDGARAARLAKIEGALLEAAWIVLGLPRSTNGDALCAEAGIAYGIARRLAHPSRAIARGDLPVSRSGLIAAGVAPDAWPEAASDAHARLLETARRDAATYAVRARARLPGLPPAALTAVRPLAMVEPYLAAQRRRPGNDPLRPSEPTPLARVWYLWLARR